MQRPSQPIRRLTEPKTCSANAARDRFCASLPTTGVIASSCHDGRYGNGAYRARTGDLVLAKHALSQLS